MKTFRFTRHARERVKERIGWFAYANRLLNKAEVTPLADGTYLYSASIYRFIVDKEQKTVITVMKDL